MPFMYFSWEKSQFWVKIFNNHVFGKILTKSVVIAPSGGDPSDFTLFPFRENTAFDKTLLKKWL